MGDQKSEIDTEEVRKIIKNLRATRDRFEEGSGSTFDVQQNGNITMRDLGDYPAARTLSESTSAAFAQISGQYQAFLTSFDGVLDALDKMVGNHDEKEQTNTAAANRVAPGASVGRRATKEWG
ncbi:hypothetical protein E1287_22365 [Actinomadura sp. KC06]|uniref:hypothetical protein n=1 Tax=Actinomadura sp. KC06 TaxID=2530369 RepID=UPI001053A76A|nr:hypothetical protein [Actinomadura sp. KC06]TDD32533.1 hypothetical protein E1287_22365 [Actinomadura sp. KC06]